MMLVIETEKDVPWFIDFTVWISTQYVTVKLCSTTKIFRINTAVRLTKEKKSYQDVQYLASYPLDTKGCAKISA